MVSGRVWSTFLAACLSLGALPAWAANHPDREWLVLETPNFLVHYYQGEANTARRIAHSAEGILPKLSEDFGVTPKKKIPIIIDRDAFFNGTAEPLKDRVTLDPVLATSSVIGTDRFVAHELAHVISFLALDRESMLSKLSNLSPAYVARQLARRTRFPSCVSAWCPPHTEANRVVNADSRRLLPARV